MTSQFDNTVQADALDAEGLYQQLLTAIRPLTATADKPVRLVGIASGGVWLAQRLQKDLGLAGESGVISSSLHRDDFSKRGLSSMGVQTKLPFDVNGATVWLIDDVLYTGRTIRAVLNELFYYGRPADVRLAVLVDRGQRELPVQADLVVARCSVPSTQSLELSQTDGGRLTFGIETAG